MAGPRPSDPRLVPAANAFGPAAPDYERARPTYPPEAIAVLTEQCGLRPGARVLDLAAGTGKLTRLLATTGATVVAVEPVPGMREQLRAAVPDVEVLDGTAEAIPLADGSVDAVTVAQAFHWFRFDEAFAEIARVLRPSGTLAILFNERDSRTPWVAAWNEAIGWHSRRISFYQATDWGAALTGAGYRDPGEARFDWSETTTPELLAARVRSVSYVAEQSPDVQQEYVSRVLALVTDLGPSFPVPYVTHLWWARTPNRT